MCNLLDMGFIILSNNPNFGNFKYTYNSIINNYGNDSFITCVYSKNTKENIKLYKEFCKTNKSSNNVAEMLNVGINSSEKEWNLILFEGIWLKQNIDKKYILFLENEKDIIYPLIYEKNINNVCYKAYNNFWEINFNGLFINKNALKEVGLFENKENWQKDWASKATNLKYKFKSILGVKII